MSDLISRQAALDNAHRQLWYRMNQQGMKDRIDEWLNNLPSVEPEIIACGEGELVEPERTDWETDHGYMWLCPKCGLAVHSDFNKCARCGNERPSDFKWHEFRQEFNSENGRYEFVDPFPEDKQHILVSIATRGHEPVQDDYMVIDCGECYLDSGYGLITDAVAWMPMPEPWCGAKMKDEEQEE